MTRRLIAGCAIVILASVVGMSLTAAEKSPVADAVERGNKAGLQTLLTQKADVNAPRGRYHRAALGRLERRCRRDQLIKAGARSPCRTGWYHAAVYSALYRNPEIVNRLIRRADAKQLGPNNETMLIAARNGILQQSRPARCRCAGGREEPVPGTTALMWAAEQSHPEAVKADGVPISASEPAGRRGAPICRRRSALAATAAKNRLKTLQETGKSIEEQLRKPQQPRGGGNNQGGGQGAAAATVAATTEAVQWVAARVVITRLQLLR
jgi:hypothetical protein